HIMSNFGAEPEISPTYDTTALFAQVIPYLRSLKEAGVGTIFDCTTAFFGRDAKLLKQLSDSTGIHIVTNTGFYGAAKDRYVPPLVLESSEWEIAQIWMLEYEEGIDGTDIRPGFIKLAFDEGEVSEVDLKLFRAGVLTHLETGLTLAVHTGGNEEAALAQLETLQALGVSPDNWVWVHANKVGDPKILLEFAQEGAWISLDGVKEENLNQYVTWLEQFRDANLLQKVLLSHDGNSFPRGGAIRPYDAIPTLLLSRLAEAGFSQEEIDQLTRLNPVEAFGFPLPPAQLLPDSVATQN
ncbi:MAG: phosphotriesterase, partial [Bacteroidota bacterium]